MSTGIQIDIQCCSGEIHLHASVLTLAPKFTLQISPKIHPHLLELIPIHVAIAAIRPGATIIPVARTLALDGRHAAVHTQGVPAVCNAALAVIHTMIVVGQVLGQVPRGRMVAGVTSAGAPIAAAMAGGVAARPKIRMPGLERCMLTVHGCLSTLWSVISFVVKIATDVMGTWRSKSLIVLEIGS